MENNEKFTKKNQQKTQNAKCCIERTTKNWDFPNWKLIESIYTENWNGNIWKIKFERKIYAQNDEKTHKKWGVKQHRIMKVEI